MLLIPTPDHCSCLVSCPVGICARPLPSAFDVLGPRTPPWLTVIGIAGKRSATVLFQAAALNQTGGGGGGGGGGGVALAFITPSRPSVSASRLLPAAAARTRRFAQPQAPGACRGGSGGTGRTSSNGPVAETTGLMAASSAAGDAEIETQQQQQKDEAALVLPRAPLPEIIVSNVPGSWAYDTMVRFDES